MSTSNFESELESYYEAQRRSHLTKSLSNATELMEETLLLCKVYNVLANAAFTPNQDVRNQVASLRENVREKKFDNIEDELPATIEELETERNNIRSALQQELHETEERIGGLEALNQRIEKIDSTRIKSLRETAKTLDNVTVSENIDFEQKASEVRSEAQEFERELRDIEDSLFEDFRGSDIEETVRALLRGEEIRLVNRAPEDLTSLKESELGPYITMSLEGE